MAGEDQSHALVVADERGIVLSRPGTLLTRMTADLLPLAHQKRNTDDLTANPRYERGRLAVGRGQFAAAAEEFCAAAELGHREAQYQLAEMFLNGKGVAKDYHSAFCWFHRAAEQGDANAQNRLGWMCESGLGADRDQTRAVNWFRMAAERGHLEAQFNLGAKYDNGEGVVQNHAEAARWYRFSAEQGLADARFFLAQALEAGEGVPEDFQEALDWYILAVEQGHRSAELKLWSHALAERYLPEDEDERIFIEKLGAKIGHPLAQFKLAYRLDVGEGLDRNSEAAIALYRKSAEQGFANACRHLEWAYRDGRGVPASAAEAAKWRWRAGPENGSAFLPRWMYWETEEADPEQVSKLRENRIAAESGQVQAMSNLACWYYFGTGTAVDQAKSLLWSRRGTAADDPYCLYLLGFMLAHGIASPVDKKGAIAHLKQAAKLGFDDAAVLAARLLLENCQEEQQLAEALDLLTTAARNGNAKAQFDLGYLYSAGTRVPRDLKTSVRWYRKAADQGDVYALFNLALQYENGSGVRRNRKKALELYEGAAQRGMVEAAEALHRIYMEGTLASKNPDLARRWEQEAIRVRYEAETKKASRGASDLRRVAGNGRLSRRERLAEKRSLQRKATDLLG